MNMNGMGGLIELVLVFGFVLAFGFIELRSIRRDRKKSEEKARKADEKAP
jgi:hypothetical protein